MFEKWKTEPNSLEYMNEEFHCLILRHPEFLHLCGYVGIPKEHPLYLVNYISDDNPIDELECHGGVTFTGNNLKGMKEDFWYIGFDCAHYMDYQPGLDKILSSIPTFTESSTLFGQKVYRDIDFVKNEITSLVEQIKSNEEVYRKNRLRYIYKK